MAAPPLAAGIAAGLGDVSRPHRRMSHWQAKTRDPNSDYGFSGRRRDNGYARSAFDCPFTARLLPLRAMSLSRIVSQYGTGGVPRIPGAVGQLRTFLLAFEP